MVKTQTLTLCREIESLLTHWGFGEPFFIARLEFLLFFEDVGGSEKKRLFLSDSKFRLSSSWTAVAV